MPIRHAIWKVGDKPQPVPEVTLGREALLEKMIVEDPTILSERWLLIGRQVHTIHGGFIDLLGMNQDGQLILIELKRDKTPREFVAQALDYASWVQDLEANDIARIYSDFSGGGSLDEAFERRFGVPLDEEQLNGSHQIVVVAASLDPSTERIVNYLNGKELPINVIFFQVFQDGNAQYLSRAWLIDPVETEGKATASAAQAKGEWNGEYYISFGHDPKGRRWEDAMRFGFISAGGAPWYSRTLFLLSAGDRVWVNVPKYGYVAVGTVLGPPVKANDFRVLVDGAQRPLREVATGNYGWADADDEEKAEYFVPVRWLDARPLSEAVSEVGFFGNQNTVCRPRTGKWTYTVDRLKRHFKNVSG